MSRSIQPPWDDLWSSLTEDDVTDWTNSTYRKRGLIYQKENRVRYLRKTSTNELLAMVTGTNDYSTLVSIESDHGKLHLRSQCTCPMGNGCKHAVAVVYELIERRKKGKKITPALDEDPRLRVFEDGSALPPDMREMELFQNEIRRNQASTTTPKKIRKFLACQSKKELIQLLMSLAKNNPRLLSRLRRAVSKAGDDPQSLINDIRFEISRLYSRTNRIDDLLHNDQGFNYAALIDRFETTLKKGYHPQLLPIARSLLNQIAHEYRDGDQLSAEISFEQLCDSIFQIFFHSKEQAIDSCIELLERLHGFSPMALDHLFQYIDNADFKLDAWKQIHAHFQSQFEKTTAQERSYYRAICIKLSERLKEDVVPYLLDIANTTHDYFPVIAYYEEKADYNQVREWIIKACSDQIYNSQSNLEQYLSILERVALLESDWESLANIHTIRLIRYANKLTYNQTLEVIPDKATRKTVSEALKQLLAGKLLPFYRVTDTEPSQSSLMNKSNPSATSVNLDHIQVQVAADWPLALNPTLHYFLPDQSTPLRTYFWELVEIAIAENDQKGVIENLNQLRESNHHRYIELVDANLYELENYLRKNNADSWMEILRTVIESYLQSYGLVAYKNAVNLLRKLYQVLQEQNRVSEWDELLSSIRDQYKQKRQLLNLLNQMAKSLNENKH